MNPIKLISTSFNDIINDLNQDPRTADAPRWLKNIFAGIFAILNIRINVIANQLFLETADSRIIVSRLVKWLDYDLRWKSTSSVLLDVTIDPTATASSSYVIPKEELIFTDNSNPPIQFESNFPFTVPQGQTSFVVEVVSKRTQETYRLGTTTGNEKTTYDLLDLDVLTETLIVVVDSITYTKVDTFAFSLPNDYNFKHEYRTDGTSFITFGFTSDSGIQYGFIPSAGLDIFVQYGIGGGIETNVSENTITNYVGNDPNILSVNNPLSARGGSNPESVNSAKRNAMLKANTHDMFWNEKSGEFLAKTLQGVYDCKLFITGFNVSGFVLPHGGLFASFTLKQAVTNLLYSKAIFSSVNNQNINVNLQDANIVNFNIIANCKLNVGINQDNTDRRIKLVLALTGYHYRNAILDYYLDNPIEDTIDYINTLLSGITGTSYDANIDRNFINTLLKRMEYKYIYNYYTDGEFVNYVLSNLSREVRFIQMVIPTGEVKGNNFDVFLPVSVEVNYIP